MRPGEVESDVRAGLRSQIFGNEDIDDALRTQQLGLPVDIRIERSADVVGTVVSAARAADIVILGAAAETWRHRRAFTALHRGVAAGWDGPLLLVKIRSGIARFTTQQVIDFMTSREPEE